MEGTDFRDCEHFDLCPAVSNNVKHVESTMEHMEKTMEKIKESDIHQTASLKSIHKRMDKHDISVSQLSEVTARLATSIDNHIAWEEEMKRQEMEMASIAQRQKDEDRRITKEAEEFRIKMYSGVAVIIVGLATWFTSYVFDAIQQAKSDSVEFRQSHKQYDSHKEKTNEALDKISKSLHILTGEFKGSK